MTTTVRVMAARIPATLDDGVWRCDDDDVKSLLDLVQVLDAETIDYSPDRDYAIAYLAVVRLGGVIVESEDVIQPPRNADDG